MVKFHTGSERTRKSANPKGLIGCNSRTDGRVRMRKDEIGLSMEWVSHMPPYPGGFFFSFKYIKKRDNIMKEQKRNGFGARRLVILALFTALAYVVMLAVRLPVSFLTMDVKDAIITLCGLYFGPLAAVIVSLIVSFVEMLSGSATGWYGFAMNFLGSAVFSATAALIYRYKKDLMGAIVDFRQACSP